MILATCFFGFLLAGFANSYRLLLVFPMPSKSHFQLGSALARGLLNAGHDVTMVAPFEMKNPPKGGGKFSNILTRCCDEQFEGLTTNLFDFERVTPLEQIPFLSWTGQIITQATINDPDFRRLLQSNEHYDAIIFEQFNVDGIKILNSHFKVPQILFSAIQANRWFNSLVGNPAPPSYIPDILTGYSVPMTFMERFNNFMIGATAEIHRHLFFYPTQNKLMKQAYSDAPELYPLLYNVSLVLVNSHESYSQAVPRVPNMVNIGGFHVEPAKPLPKDLQEFMDSAEDGVVYFSLGSSLPQSMMPKASFEILKNVLGKLKQKVLWKWDDDEFPNKPDNVKISKWFPQQDILAHPNCRVFITHGGTLSIIESVNNGVPTLVLPVCTEEKLNAAQAKSFGSGISLSISQITEESLSAALKNLLDNPKYKDNAKRRAVIMHDRLVKPLETAVYWVEYVIRHKGAPHLRVAAVDLPFYEYYSFDVMLFLIFVNAIPLLIIYLIFKKCRQHQRRQT